MIKSIAGLKYVIGNREFHFYCDNDSPTTEVKEAFFHFLKVIGQIEDNAKAARAEAENKVPEVEEESNEGS